MPKKIRELIKSLKKAGFVNRSGKGSHQNFKHPAGQNITLSGKPGHDAKRYQERDVKKAIHKVRNENKR